MWLVCGLFCQWHQRGRLRKFWISKQLTVRTEWLIFHDSFFSCQNSPNVVCAKYIHLLLRMHKQDRKMDMAQNLISI